MRYKWQALAALILFVCLFAAGLHSQQTQPDSMPGCIFNSVAPTLATGQQVPWQCDVNGKLITSGGGAVVGAAVQGGISGCNLFVTSTLTLGCVAAITESDTGSTLTLTGNLLLPDTASAGAVGVIQFGGARFIHDTGGNSNVYLGHNAANLTATGTNNVAVGESAGLGLAAGSSNTAVGRFALGTNSAGANNTAVGATALGSATGGSNTGVGQNALPNVAGGTGNTAIGTGTGAGITTGVDNTIIGRAVTGLAAGLSNAVIIASGPGTSRADFGNTTASIWTFSSTLSLPLTTDATHTDATVCRDITSGQLFFGSGAAGICLGTSSLRFKHDIAPLQAGLEELLHLDTITYHYNAGYGDPAQKLYGFTAEQMVSILPELVRNDSEGRPNSIDWAGLVPVIVRAIQQQQVEIDELKRRVK